MDPSRYELLAEIASGDFAVVYRGRDRELGREVAIKQIHQQYLNDSRTLERFWREAQLLASLEHRNIMTIYDMVRSRGWLVLELMPASLQNYAHGEPLDLDLLRVALSCSLQALQYLHANHIIHGDIKPSNLFVDKRLWVKVGDFGLARRASNEQGSMLKGTTRYMAPELVSQQFGAVGPASDLYSLGFSAYELMCGSQFDALFPGLEAFGRDKQIAWMMWHAAPDRRLPPISRVLSDVPDDLRHVIEKLVAKNPAERYRTAGEALADLKSRLQLVDASGEAAETEEDLAAAAKLKRRKRILGMTVTAFLSCAALLGFVVLNPPAKPTGPPPLPPPWQAIVRTMLTDQHKMVVEDLATHGPKEVDIRADDQLFLNGDPSLLRDIQEGDHITIRDVRNDAGKVFHELKAVRADRSRGTVAEVDADNEKLTVDLGTPAKAGKQLVVLVPPDLPIRFNNQPLLQGKAVTLADLLPGDQVSVEHSSTGERSTPPEQRDTREHGGDDDLRQATALSVTRVVPLEGYLRALDTTKRELTIALGLEDKAPLEVWPVAAKCEIKLNGQRFVGDELLKLTDLKPGDEINVQHDTQIVAIEAERTFHQSGVIYGVHANRGAFDMLPKGEDQPVTHRLAADCKIRLADEAVQLADLHRGDEVTISFDSIDSAKAVVLSITAVRRPDPLRWALIVSEQAYEDKGISLLPYAGADARLVAQTLVKRFQVPLDQVLSLNDDTKTRWEQTIPGFIEKVPADARLLVYYVGHAYADKAGKVWLAPKDFALAAPDTTGVGLSWFVGQIEKSPVRDKLLLLDATHRGAKSDVEQEPSSAEMIQSLLEPGALSPVRTLTAIASCKAGERAQDAREKNHGLFAWHLAAGLAGAADKDEDNRIDSSELAEYLFASLSGGPASQTPALFLPDNTPPRLTEDAKKAIRRLASNLLITKIDPKKAAEEYAAAQQLAGKEPEPKLIYGLLLLKAKKDTDALDVFLGLKAEQQDNALPLMGAAWAHFHRQDFAKGVDAILQLLNRLESAGAQATDDGKFVTSIANWAGRMREFAGTGASDQRRPPQTSLEQVDTAAKQLPPNVQDGYKQGRAHVQRMIVVLDKQIAEAGDEAERGKLQVKRKQLLEYVSFPFEVLSRRVLDGMQEASAPKR